MELSKIIAVFFYVGALFTSCQNDTTKSKVGGNKEIITKDDKAILKVTDTYSVDGIRFQLLQNGKKAEIKVDAKDKVVHGNIKLSPPCYFLKRRGKVQSFSYPDVEIDHTLIFLGDTVGTDRKRYWGFDDNDDFSRICGEAIQGILIKRDSIIITERVLDGGFRCENPGTDEKDYWDFAHTRATVKDARKQKYR